MSEDERDVLDWNSRRIQRGTETTTKIQNRFCSFLNAIITKWIKATSIKSDLYEYFSTFTLNAHFCVSPLNINVIT